MKYFSQEWVDAIKEKMASDEAYKRKNGKWDTKLCSLVLGAPGGVDIFVEWNIQDGQLVSVNRQEKPAPSDWRKEPFDGKKYVVRSTAPYEAYAKLNRREMNFMKAIMTGGYKIDGMVKVLPMVGKMTAWTDLQAFIPCEY